jgi:AmmeMemoRadiSam system protein A
MVSASHTVVTRKWQEALDRHQTAERCLEFERQGGCQLGTTSAYRQELIAGLHSLAMSPADSDPCCLSAEAQKELLQIARRSLEVLFVSGKRPHFEPEAPELLRSAGAFVTLRLEGRLRGCIGTFVETDPLVDVVARMAIAAATSDPRFPPLRQDELPQTRIEISILSPSRPASADEVEVGRHGLCVAAGGRRGVLLPQVAVEHGWDRETFLDHTCRKAGLPETAWRSPSTEIETFTAQVFGEQ